MTAAQPLARYGAMWKARVASGCATLKLHHLQGVRHAKLMSAYE
jgi:cytochrome c5